MDGKGSRLASASRKTACTFGHVTEVGDVHLRLTRRKSEANEYEDEVEKGGNRSR
jgi:hypothetical protein